MADNKGTLKRNRNPRGERSPSHTGQIEIFFSPEEIASGIVDGIPPERAGDYPDGLRFSGWLNGWVNTDEQSGEKYFGLSFRPKQSYQSWQADQQAGEPDERDEVPM